MKLLNSKTVLMSAGLLLAVASAQVSASFISTLEARDLDGDASTIEAYYDTQQDITWLADANAAGTGMSWASANAWAAGLNIGGVTGWRLPSLTDTGLPGCEGRAYSGTDCGWNVDLSTGEMAHMFYATLGGVGRYDTGGNELSSGYGVADSSPFINLEAAPYWTSEAYSPDTSMAWYFDFTGGFQGEKLASNNYYAWAVHNGDVGAAVVPIPAAVWLFGSGLLGLAGLGARRKA